MRYGRFEDIALFKGTPQGGQYTIPKFNNGGAPPLVPLTPDGTNLYVDAGLMIQAGGMLTAEHAAVVTDVGDNINNGILNVGLEPTTGGHELVINSGPTLASFFQALDSLIWNGLRIVVRYASEFNGSNSWSGQPDAYQQAIRVVNQARAHTRILLTFSPGINEGQGDWRGSSAETSIRSYWVPDLFDAVSCTFYARPEDASDTLDAAIGRSLDRLVAYLAQVGAPVLGFDEFGASAAANDSAAATKNDVAIHRLMNRILDDADLAGKVFDYTTLFLSEKWGQDATLGFLADANAAP